MATATKKMNIFKVLFGSGIDEENYEEVELPEELKKAQAAINEKDIVKGFNCGAKKSGISPKIEINPRTEAAMRKKHGEVAKQIEDRER